MTGEPAISALESVPSLDPAPYQIESETPREPILCVAEIDAEVRAKFSAVKPKQSCNCYHGMTFATVARKHLAEPGASTRAALLTMPVTTRADAMVALDLLALGDDAELRAHLIAGLRSFLDVV